MSEKTCKNCRHWNTTKCDEDYWHELDDAKNDVSGKELEMRRITGFAVGKCMNMPQFIRPAFSSGASVHDGSEYMATLITGPDFGCTMFTAPKLLPDQECTQ